MPRKKRKHDLERQLVKLKARIESAGMKPSDLPMFAFPRHEVEEIMNYYMPYTSATQKRIHVEYGSAVSIFGFKGIAV